jgi:hypothetical protein
MWAMSFESFLRFREAVRTWRGLPFDAGDDQADAAGVRAPRTDGPQGRTPGVALVEPDDRPFDLDVVSGRDTFIRS